MSKIDNAAEISEAEQRFRDVTEAAGEYIWELDSKGLYTFVSKPIEELLGVPVEQALGRTPLDFMPPEEAEWVGAWLAKLLERREPFRGLEHRSLKSDGSVVWQRVSGVPILDSSGELRGYRGAALDITKEKMAHQELEEREKRLALILDNTVDGFITIDSERRILSFNQAAKNIFGYEADEVLGRNVKMLMPEPYHSGHDQYVGNYLAGGEKKVIGIGREVKGRRKGGEVFPMLLSVSETVVGEERLFVGSVQDITERKQQEARLREAIVKAEAANRSKSEFLANMSHEIRTPMNAIIGLGQLALKSEPPPPPKLYDYLEKITGSAETLLLLINDILDLAKIETGNMAIDQVPFNLSDILDKLKKLMGQRAADKGLQLIFTVDPTVPDQMVGDPQRLSQVLINLTSNAIKFSEKGEVSLSFEMADSNDDTLTLKVTIRDTGIGIASEQLETIFQPFTQADGSSTRKYGGTGLGLSIAKKLVELMGGKLEVKSEPGQGSSFFFNCSLGRSLQIKASIPEQADGPPPQAATTDTPTGMDAWQQLPGINTQAALERMQIDIGFYDKLLRSFREEYDQKWFMALREAVAKGDYPLISKLAHSLKGTAANLGAENLAPLASHLEEATQKASNPTKLKLKMVQFTKELGKMFSAISAYCEKGQKPDPAVIDHQKALCSLNDDENFFHTLLEDFYQEYRKTANELREMVTQGETLRAADLLFAIQGTAASLGAGTLANLSGQIRQMLANCPTRTALAALSDEMERQTTQIATAIDNLPPLSAPAAVVANEDQEKIGQLQKELAKMLSAHDLSALDHFATLKAAMSTNTPHPLLPELERLIKKLDFTKAGELLTKMKS